MIFLDGSWARLDHPYMVQEKLGVQKAPLKKQSSKSVDAPAMVADGETQKLAQVGRAMRGLCACNYARIWLL